MQMDPKVTNIAPQQPLAEIDWREKKEKLRGLAQLTVKHDGLRSREAEGAGVSWSLGYIKVREARCVRFLNNHPTDLPFSLATGFQNNHGNVVPEDDSGNERGPVCVPFRSTA